MKDVLVQAKKIRLVIFDIDGVLTDGKLFFDDEGREYKSFHARDGLGIKLLQQSGVAVGVISGRSSRSVELRMKSLGISYVYQGQEDKVEAFETMLAELELKPDQVVHVGDDLIDLSVMNRVGLPIAVADANPAVRQCAHWCTTLNGGCGAAREVCDMIMDAQGTLAAAVEAYL